MKISLDYLNRIGACLSSRQSFVDKFGNTDVDVQDVMNALLQAQRWDWIEWLFLRDNAIGQTLHAQVIRNTLFLNEGIHHIETSGNIVLTNSARAEVKASNTDSRAMCFHRSKGNFFGSRMAVFAYDHSDVSTHYRTIVNAFHSSHFTAMGGSLFCDTNARGSAYDAHIEWQSYGYLTTYGECVVNAHCGTVEAHNATRVTATDCTILAYDSTRVDALRNAKVTAHDSAHVKAEYSNIVIVHGEEVTTDIRKVAYNTLIRK